MLSNNILRIAFSVRREIKPLEERRTKCVPAAGVESPQSQLPVGAALLGSQLGSGGASGNVTRCSLLPEQEHSRSQAQALQREVTAAKMCHKCVRFCTETLMGPKEAMMEGNPLNHVSSRAFPAEELLKGLWRLVFCTHPHREADGEERGNCHPASIWQTLRLCCNFG